MLIVGNFFSLIVA